jgi:F-type H+-transporting ATPase subunit gamma
VKRIGIILVTTDKGLCGALNSNLIRQTLRFMKDQKVPSSLVTIGRRGRDFMKRIDIQILGEITGMIDRPNLLDVVPAAKVMMEDFLQGKLDQVFIAYNSFVNTMVQRPVISQIIPCPLPPGVERRHDWDYLYEPSSEEVLSGLLPRYVESLVYHAVLENIASEHSARMVAMKSATENAKEIINGLNLTYNKARQASITKEMCEIAAGSAAVGK